MRAWLARNKRWVGAVVGLAALGVHLGWPGHDETLERLEALIAGLLLGGGGIESDRAARLRQDWERSGGYERRGT